MYTSVDTFFREAITPESDLDFRPVAPDWYWINWRKAIRKHYPVLKLKTEDSLNESILFRAVQTMADEAGRKFEDAAIWILHRALDTQLSHARKMVLDEMPWDTRIQHICRVMAMLVCKRYYSVKRQSLRKVDNMIWPLVISRSGFRPCVVRSRRPRRRDELDFRFLK